MLYNLKVKCEVCCCTCSAKKVDYYTQKITRPMSNHEAGVIFIRN